MCYRVFPLFVGAVLTIFAPTASAAIVSSSLYSSLSGSPSGANLDVANLFNQPLFDDAANIGADTGSGDDAGRSYGTDPAVGNAVVEFQLDQVYALDTLYYAQRQFNENQNRDKNQSVSIWASATNPFSLAAPGTAADIVDLVLNSTTANDEFLAYALGSTITGQFFRLEFVDAPNGGNIDATGGAELRLGGVAVAVPEPSSFATLLVAGTIACGKRRRRRE